jgi:hypothetical protein
MRSFAILASSALLAVSCGCARPGGGPAGPPAGPRGRTVVAVRNVEELIQAIGPDREIELAPGEYNLARLKQRKMEHVRWGQGVPDDDDDSVTIRNLSNLTLRGMGERRVRIVVAEPYATVLQFENVKGLRLENLEVGHHPKPGYCTGGVLGFLECADVAVRNCDLFGCGTCGVGAEKTRDLTVTRSVIRDCTYCIMCLNDCEGCRFEESHFHHNKEFTLISVYDCAKIELRACRIEDNQAGSDEAYSTEALFHVQSSSDVVMTGGALRRNKVTYLLNRKDAIVFKDVASEGNKYLKGEYAKE